MACGDVTWAGLWSTCLHPAQVFVRVYTSAAAVKDSPSKLAYVFQSQGCDAFYFQRVGRKVHTNGRHSRCLHHGGEVCIGLVRTTFGSFFYRLIGRSYRC